MGVPTMYITVSTPLPQEHEFFMRNPTTLMRIAHSLTLLCLLGAATISSAQVQILDKVVAIVDDDVVLASELQERLLMIQQNLERRGVEMPDQETLARETLDRLILESIQLQLADRYGVRVPDAQLDDAMQRMAAQNSMSLEAFRGALEAEGESFVAMREQVRKEIMIQRVQQGNVNRNINITEQEVENFMATEEGEAMTQPEFRVVQALVEVSSKDSNEEKAAKEAFVDGVLASILAGTPFQEAVATLEPYVFTGGDLGWRKIDAIPSMFAGVIPSLKTGDTAKVESGAGFHLVYLVDERGRERLIEQTNVRHILIKPTEVLSDEAAQQRAAQLRARILDGEDFAMVAKEYSDDIGSATEGGAGLDQPGSNGARVRGGHGEYRYWRDFRTRSLRVRLAYSRSHRAS